MGTRQMEKDERLRVEFSERISDGLKKLFQTKHLYQNVMIEQTMEGFSTVLPPGLSQGTYTPPGELWFPVKDSDYDINAVRMGILSFRTPDVKLFCETCKRVEPFNSIFATDLLQLGATKGAGFKTKRGVVQVFVFSFLCQGCKSVPEVFIVRREDLKLILCGRAPIEHIEVPNVIPKQIKPFYSGAIVAHQSGQTLAGIFLLRTLIEQWAQSAAANKDLPADKIIDSYLSTLPDDFKKRFPSLRTLYGELSIDIHTATGSAELFEKACNQTVEHFEARRLFKLISPG